MTAVEMKERRLLLVAPCCAMSLGRSARLVTWSAACSWKRARDLACRSTTGWIFACAVIETSVDSSPRLTAVERSRAFSLWCYPDVRLAAGMRCRGIVPYVRYSATRRDHGGAVCCAR